MISHCPTCGTKIHPMDFISLSFLLASDICRHCLDDEPSGHLTKYDHMVMLCYLPQPSLN